MFRGGISRRASPIREISLPYLYRPPSLLRGSTERTRTAEMKDNFLEEMPLGAPHSDDPRPDALVESGTIRHRTGPSAQGNATYDALRRATLDPGRGR